MDISLLTREDWKALYKKYPSLESEMAGMAQVHEKEIIRHQLAGDYLTKERRQWLTERLEQLTQFDNLYFTPPQVAAMIFDPVIANPGAGTMGNLTKITLDEQPEEKETK